MNKKQQIEEIAKIIDEVKREAIKEFAKRLESEAVESSDMYTCGMAVTVSAIEKLVKEYLG